MPFVAFGTRNGGSIQWLTLSALVIGSDPRKYWFDMKRTIKAEGFTQSSEKIRQLKLPSTDGKEYKTDCADTETLLRIIQSIPSPKAEPFKRWLAQVGAEVIEEAENLDALYLEWRAAAIESYTSRGYAAEWAEQRVDSIVARNALTHEWSVRGITAKEFAILTDRLHMNMFGLTVQSHMGYKNFPVTRRGRRLIYQGNLRDAMTLWELAVTTFGEGIARALHVEHDSRGFAAIAVDVDEAGAFAQAHRELLEQQLGHPVVSPVNAIPAANTLWGELLPPADDGPVD